jgi:hypothetical protein
LGAYYVTVTCTLPNLNLFLYKPNLINGLEKSKLVMADPGGRVV